MANADKTPRNFEISWLIENYFSLYVNNEKSWSPKSLADSEWYVQLIPQHSKEQIKCYLHRISENAYDENFSFDYEYNFTNVKGDVLKSETGLNCVFEKGHYITIDMDQFSEKFQNFYLNFIIKCELPMLHAVGCNIKTTINTKRCIFKCSIRNSSSFSQAKRTFYLDSSEFKIELTKSDDLYTIFIYRLDEKSSETVEGKLCFLDVQGDVLATVTLIHDFSDGIWKSPALKANEISIHPKERYVVACQFTSSGYVEPINLVTYTYDSNLPRKKGSFLVVDEDVQHLLSVNEDWDVLLQADDKNLPAHRNILCVHSPVFAAMFQHDMPESQISVVKIPYISAEIMKLFLNFIYCNKVQCIDYYSCIKLFLAAYEYQVLGLRDKCVDILISLLEDNNVCELLVAADKYECDQLKNRALNHLLDNLNSIVIEPYWSQWLKMNKKLSADMFIKLGIKLKNLDSSKKRLITECKDSQDVLYTFVSTLLEAGADPNTQFEYNITFIAIVNKLKLNRIINLLLGAGTRPTYEDLLPSFKTGDLAVIETLLQRGAPVSSSSTHCESALHLLSDVVSKEKTISVCKLLIKHGGDVDFENECYNTPLFFAVDCGDAEAIAALLHYGGQPCYKCPRGSPLERSFHLNQRIVQNIVRYAALYVDHAQDSEMYAFFQYFTKEMRDRDLLNGKPFLKFAQQCMAEINVLKDCKINQNGNSMFNFIVSQGDTLKSFHDDPSVIRKVNEQLNISKISIYREVLEKKLNKNYLI